MNVSTYLTLRVIRSVITWWFRMCWRFATGAPMDGRARTNAGWFAPGTRALTQTGRATRWAHLPRHQRAGWRFAVFAVVVAVLYGLVVAPTLTRWLLALATLGGTALLGWRGWRWWRVRQHVERYVRPLHVVLSTPLGLPAMTKPTDWLDIPLDFQSNEEAPVKVTLPPQFTGSAEGRRMVTDIVSDKLGLSDFDATFHMIGAAPNVVFRLAPRPPDKVRFAAVRQAFEAAPDSAPVIGFGNRGKVIAVDLDSESPHILVSASSGGGKSVIIRTILSQGLNRGAQAIVLDVKRQSHRWVRGNPNVRYYRDVEDIHEALIGLAAEGDRRNHLTDDIPDDVDTTKLDLGPRIFLVAEEMNATITRLQRYWNRIRTNADPKTSPAVDALGEILFMGRAVKIHVIAVAQLATARTLGGPELRENFATRILARYTVNAWRMLAPEIWPMPKSSRKPGRVQVVLAGNALETQVAFLTDSEAREWALAGGSQQSVPEWRAGGAVAPSQRRSDRDELGTTAETVPATEDGDGGRHLRVVRNPEDEQIGLREAIDRDVVWGSLAAVRKARTRDPEFPDSVGMRGQEALYRVGDLQRWQRNRPRQAPSDEQDSSATA